jgi:CheY-like chemotaxis protein
MVFSTSGQEALKELARAPFDVIISDIEMPGMGGASLLQTVKQDYPRVARIVLSAQTEREVVVRVLPVAHQFLSKPCDPELLRTVIERTCNLQTLLHEDAIREVVGKVDTLPSLPRSYVELSQAANRDDMGLAQIARIIEEDPAMSAKALQLVNSAYFGLARRITSIQQAVTYLGMELLKGLALTAHVFARMKGVSVPGFSLDQLQRSSLQRAWRSGWCPTRRWPTKRSPSAWFTTSASWSWRSACRTRIAASFARRESTAGHSTKSSRRCSGSRTPKWAPISSESGVFHSRWSRPWRSTTPRGS